ncbi:TIGR03086 family metal-binding protein [Actinocatenispora sera]|uniref:TIGR03086 family protein n=1 Tax=Actinocatenispora sera TaxID=390989 RepID=A0A810L3T3_9ACTN|nr:TIGR03086 family metal-binding protein [Actinocatenispora sera]BCJ29565.1 TIGR03086 family protein [Actinocatenispora sera]
MHIDSLVELDRRAVRASAEVVRRVTPADLIRPTPCGDWDLAALLAHMTGQHRGFAAAAAGRGDDLAAWRPVLAADPVAAHLAAADQVLTAFAAPGLDRRRFTLPEITRAPDFPATQAIGFHLVDYVVHGWDVATALGLDTPPLDDAVLAAALRIARAVPDGSERLAPGAAFAPAHQVPAGTATFDEILLLLGRRPGPA